MTSVCQKKETTESSTCDILTLLLHLLLLTRQALTPAAAPAATRAEPTPLVPAARTPPRADTPAGQATPNNTWNQQNKLYVCVYQERKATNQLKSTASVPANTRAEPTLLVSTLVRHEGRSLVLLRPTTPRTNEIYIFKIFSFYILKKELHFYIITCILADTTLEPLFTNSH